MKKTHTGKPATSLTRPAAAQESRDPLIRIAKRESMVWYMRWLVRIIAVILSLVVTAVVIKLLTDINPVEVYKTMFKGALGDKARTWTTVRDTAVLLCIAVGLTPAFRMRFWNIGAEGQMLMGGLATAALMIYGTSIPTPILLVIMFFVSAVVGALWGLLPAVCKAKWNTNETLFTLMMNYVAIQIIELMVDVWDKSKSHSLGVINKFTALSVADGSWKHGWFPEIIEGGFVLNVAIIAVITLIMFLYLRYTKQGYEISVVGESENTARYAGINVKKVIIRTMLISGAVCGIAGFVEVAGASHTISSTISGGRGFTAIIVAWLAKFNTASMILISLLIVFLDKGAGQIATDCQLNQYASKMITGIILFFILGCEFFINYRVIIRRMHKEAASK